MSALLWLRRDLRLHDHPALLAAAEQGEVTVAFVLDDQLRGPSGAPRIAFLYRTLRALADNLSEVGGQLVIRQGLPEKVIPALAREVGAHSVHVSADFAPYGAARDSRVEQALGDVDFVRTGSPYAIAPGRITKDDGTAFKVYSAFYRRWRAHGWRAPAQVDIAAISWAKPIASEAVPDDPQLPASMNLSDVGEKAALKAWQKFAEARLQSYADERDRPDLDHTSRMSPYLRFGSIHPRTLLARLDESPAHETYRKELAWREFYAAVLHFWPQSAREYFLPEMANMRYDSGSDAGANLAAWQLGHTGYPIVDAGMRQLLAEGWMHNRVRMIVASFLVKDLHIEWTHGARHFMRHLVDADLASNQHGWQWTAGTGTDAAPYFRIFNPATQGKKFDPDGDYIRRYVPELSELSAKEIHEPVLRPNGYPEPIVDHANERDESMRRYQEIRKS